MYKPPVFCIPWLARELLLVALIFVAVVAMGFGIAHAQTPISATYAPPCVPYLTASNPLQAAGYTGSSLVVGSTPTHRWSYYTCEKAGQPLHVVKIVGLREGLAAATLAGRIGTIEASPTPMKALATAWKRYVTLPLNDPALKPGLDALNADLHTRSRL